MNQPNTTDRISLRTLFARYRLRIIGTWLLVAAEGGLFLSFPLFMGMTIDDLLQSSYRGLMALLGVGVVSLLVGAARRYYDTRVYAAIYTEISSELVERERKRDAPVSVVSARVDMLREFVEFLEDAFPQIINSAIALVGTLGLLIFLQWHVFIVCLVATCGIVLVYGATSKKTYTLNKGYNDELERRVEVLSENDARAAQTHFTETMSWNIRLSDLETANFSVSWVLLIGVLCASILVTVQGGVSAHGKILSILMYVFNYMESVLMIPLFYQQLVRLQEIGHRLEG